MSTRYFMRVALTAIFLDFYRVDRTTKALYTRGKEAAETKKEAEVC